MFELGFFSPGKSKNRYLGIWYKKISKVTVVWVANRETPIKDTSGVLKVSREGNLLLFNGGNNMLVWSSNSTRSNNTEQVVVELLDNGNLILKDKSLIWQSFDYPSDTYLPGMKIGKDLVTGIERVITSWKSPDDPSIGAYISKVDTNGYPQYLTWRGQTLVSRLGPWNGLEFSGFIIDKANPIYSSEFVFNQKEVYHKIELKSLVVLRTVLTWDGKTLIMHWIERIQEWAVYADLAVDICGQFGLCGPYGSCSVNKHPPCTCIKGFEPKIPKEWDASDWSSGCKRTKPLKCENRDGFEQISRVKVPDTRRSWYNYSMTLGECKIKCRKNCSCTAYTSLDIGNGGSGCLLWLDELMDIRECDSCQHIYIPMAASELEGPFDSNRRKRVFIILLSMSSVGLLLSGLASACRKTPYMKGLGKWGGERHRSQKMEHLDDLQFFRFCKLARATDNFSVSNKIGEGGFGPVYKGVLEDGQEVAVKKLSETSQQGLDEFTNEVICIAKLQHRNLVKLLGYCTHGN